MRKMSIDYNVKNLKYKVHCSVNPNSMGGSDILDSEIYDEVSSHTVTIVDDEDYFVSKDGSIVASIEKSELVEFFNEIITDMWKDEYVYFDEISEIEFVLYNEEEELEFTS